MDQTDIEHLVTLCSAGLSVLGTSAVLLVSYRVLKPRGLFRSPAGSSVGLLMILAWVDLAGALSLFLPTYAYSDSVLCTAQGVLNQFFYLSSFLWVASIAHFYSRVVLYSDQFPDKFLPLYHFIAWSYPAASVVVGLLFESYANTGLWCWISQSQQLFRWIFFYGPMCLVMLYILIIYFRLSRHYHSLLLDWNSQNASLSRIPSPDSVHSDAPLNEEVQPNPPTPAPFDLSLFILMFVVIRLPSLANRLYDVIEDGDQELFALALLQALCSPLQGFVNSILFWKSKVVLRYLKKGRNQEIQIDESLNERRDLKEEPSNRGSGEVESSELRLPTEDLSAFETVKALPHVSVVPLELPDLEDVKSPETCSFVTVLATWNLANSTKIDDSSLQKLLTSAFNHPKADLVFVAFQECNIPEWSAQLHRVLGKDKFVLVTAVELSSIKIACFSSKDFLSALDISKTATSREATGIGKVMGNKGSVAISLRIGSSSGDFINVSALGCHLAAHSEKLAARMDDIKQIMSHLTLSCPEVARNPDVSCCFDLSFFLGDLNFRIDGLDREEVFKLIDSNDAAELLKHDQLRRLRELNAVLEGFVEPSITFMPTFKLKSDGSYSEKRIPSYCDRILFRNRKRISVSPLHYQSVVELSDSDHKPVVQKLFTKFVSPSSGPLKDLSSWKFRFSELAIINATFQDGFAPEDPYILVQCSIPWVLETLTVKASVKTQTVPPSGSSQKAPVPSLKAPDHSLQLDKSLPGKGGRTRSLIGFSKFPKSLKISKSSEYDIQRAFIWITLKDFEMQGDQDVVGFCTIDLWDYFQSVDKSKTVELPLTRASSVVGTVTCSASLTRDL